MANWVSVEQALTDSGLFQDFENKVSLLTEENIIQLTVYLDQLKYYSKHLTLASDSISLQAQIAKKEKKLTHTQKALDSNNGDWSVVANLTDVYKSARSFRSMTTQVQNLKSHWDEINKNSQLESFIKRELINLMQLEHDIMAALYQMNFFKQNVGDAKGHNPIVDEYVIYFYGDTNSDGTKEIIRGRVASDDEVLMKNLVVNSSGDIELSKSIIQDMLNMEHEVIANAKDPANTDNTYQTYMDELIKESGAFYNDIVKKVSSLLKESKGMHLGNDKDSDLDAAAIALSEKDLVDNIIEEHQNNLRQFLYYDQAYDGALKNRINRGHFAEAFERLYQAHKDANPGEPNIDYATIVQESLGNDPWYMQGDVGTSQVKSFFDKSNRRVASFKSLSSLCEKLIVVLSSILSGNKQNLIGIQKVAERHCQIQKSQLDKANTKLQDDYCFQVADKLVSQVLKKS